MRIVSLNIEQWLICVAAGAVLLIVDEVIKFFMRRRRPSAQPIQAVVEAKPAVAA